MENITENKLEEFAELIASMENVIRNSWFATCKIEIHLHIQVTESNND